MAIRTFSFPSLCFIDAFSILNNFVFSYLDVSKVLTCNLTSTDCSTDLSLLCHCGWNSLNRDVTVIFHPRLSRVRIDSIHTHTHTHTHFPHFTHPLSTPFQCCTVAGGIHHLQRASVPVTCPRDPCHHEHDATTIHPVPILYTSARAVGDAVFHLTFHTEPKQRDIATLQQNTLTDSAPPANIRREINTVCCYNSLSKV